MVVVVLCVCVCVRVRVRACSSAFARARACVCVCVGGGGWARTRARVCVCVLGMGVAVYGGGRGGGGVMLFHCRMHETEGQNFARLISIEVVFWCDFYRGCILVWFLSRLYFGVISIEVVFWCDFYRGCILQPVIRTYTLCSIQHVSLYVKRWQTPDLIDKHLMCEALQLQVRSGDTFPYW